MKKTIFALSLLIPFACLLLAAPRTAEAQTTPQLNKTTETAATSRGLWLEFKVGSTIGHGGGLVLLSTSPGILVGYKLGRLVLGAEVSAGYSSSVFTENDSTTKYRSAGFTVIPLLQYNLVNRGPVAFYLYGGAGIAMSWWGAPGLTEDPQPSLGVLVQLGTGVRYYLHPRFALGVEVAASTAYSERKMTTSTGDTSKHQDWRVGVRGALTAAVVF